jgi:hypothetical protein
MRADSLRADDPIPRSRDNYPPRGSRDLSFPSLARRRHCWRGGVGGGMVRKSESRISVKWQGGLGSIIPARPVPWDGLPRRIGTEAMHGKTRSGNNEARAQISLGPPWDVNWLRKQANGCTENRPDGESRSLKNPENLRDSTHSPPSRRRPHAKELTRTEIAAPSAGSRDMLRPRSDREQDV